MKGLALAALLWIVGISMICAVPAFFAMGVTVLSWGFWVWRKNPRRQQALRTMFVLVFPCMVGVSMLAKQRRSVRIEAAAIAQAREFRRIHGRYPTEHELAARVSVLPGVGPGLNDVSYMRTSRGDDALVIRTVVSPFGRRITSVSSGRVAYLD
jgi:hypothetical protein